MERVELPRLRCAKCGHDWIPRRPDPAVCPRCKTSKWRNPATATLSKAEAELMRMDSALKAAEPETTKLPKGTYAAITYAGDLIDSDADLTTLLKKVSTPELSGRAIFLHRVGYGAVEEMF